MPLFDFFKKSNKKQSGSQADNDKLFSPEQNKKRYDAAMDFLQFFQEKTPLLNGKPHAGTVLSIGARLAGTSLYRSINKKDVAPGTVVLSEEVNQTYPKLLNLFAHFCKQYEIDVMGKPLVQEIPEQDKPLMDLVQVQENYQDEYNEIMKKHGLDHLVSAQAGMIVCSILFNYHCMNNKDIDPYIATGIVAMGVVEGAKTIPVPLGSNGVSTTSENDSKDQQVTQLIRTIAESSISGSGTRLVLGEKFAAGKEAQANGGKYLLVHPEVQEQLKGANIDVYVIYVTALIIAMENKIPQIEFIDTNVDELAQEWNGKSSDRVPMYVRQILWLKENAEKFGYVQRGNSWKLNR